MLDIRLLCAFRHKNKQGSPSKLRLATFRLKGKLGFLLKLKQGSLLFANAKQRGAGALYARLRGILLDVRH